MDGSLWPAVYQGLDVYHEPSGPLSAPPAASLLGFTSFSQGEHPASIPRTPHLTALNSIGVWIAFARALEVLRGHWRYCWKSWTIGVG